jgi:Transposase DDE domain
MASIAAATRQFNHKLATAACPLAEVFNEALIHRFAHDAKHVWRNCFWRPAVVILTFLRQVLTRDCSCRRAVIMTCAASADPRQPRIRQDPSAYSQARQALPIAILQLLAKHLCSQFDSPQRKWCGHHTFILDGTGISMPDTPSLQKKFPQSGSQKPGCGFPTMRLVVLFCWASGALLELAYDTLQIGETRLFRRLIERIQANAVIVADRLFGTYCEIALLRRRQAHAVFRVHNARRIDFRCGKRLGADDRLQVWHRPKRRTAGLSVAEWAEIPDTMEVRVVRVCAPDRRGFRRRRLILVTTLLDAEAYPAEALGELYRDRWLVEVSLRNLKTTQGMDVLRCKSPAMIDKEVLLHQIAYNAIRLLMRDAACAAGTDLWRISFAGAQERLAALLSGPNVLGSGSIDAAWQLLLGHVARDRVPQRQNRKEPRALKRRHKVFPYLVHPRAAAREMAYYDSHG